MPEANKFVSGFGLIKDKMYAGYKLTDIKATEHSISRYREYSYDITLTFTHIRGDYNSFYDTIYDLISQSKTIYGVRNPYRCVIDDPQDGDIIEDVNRTITWNLHGHSYRQ